jgi:hypothetical protein
LLVLTFVIPSALFGVVGGIVTDRLPKGELLLTTGLLRTALCLFFLHGNNGVALIYATNFGLAFLTQFASPAESAALPQVVLDDQVVAATAALNLENILAQVLGTVLLAPLLVRTLGVRPLFALAAAAFLTSSILYARIAGIDEPPEAISSNDAFVPARGRLASERQAALESWRLIRGDNQVLVSVVAQTLVATTVVVLISIVPIYTRRVLHLPAEYSVAVFSPAAIGMFISVRMVPLLARHHAKTRLASIGFAIFVVGLLLLGFERELSLLLSNHDPAGLLGIRMPQALYSRVALSAVVSGPMGFAYGIVVVAARAILYDRVPLAMQGRVFAFQSVLSSLASILPLILVGLVAYWLGPRAVLVLVAVVNVLPAWYAMRLVSGSASEGPHTLTTSNNGDGAALAGLRFED